MYGTLKKGYQNHSLLIENEAIFIQNFILKDYALYQSNDVHFPIIVDQIGYEVYGEIYQISQELITILDKFENVPFLYQRVEIGSLNNTKIWAYTMKNEAIKDFPKLNKSGLF